MICPRGVELARDTCTVSAYAGQKAKRRRELEKFMRSVTERIFTWIHDRKMKFSSAKTKMRLPRVKLRKPKNTQVGDSWRKEYILKLIY